MIDELIPTETSREQNRLPTKAFQAACARAATSLPVPLDPLTHQVRPTQSEPLANPCGQSPDPELSNSPGVTSAPAARTSTATATRLITAWRFVQGFSPQSNRPFERLGAHIL